METDTTEALEKTETDLALERLGDRLALLESSDERQDKEILWLVFYVVLGFTVISITKGN